MLTSISEFATGATAADLSMMLDMEIPFPTMGLSPLMVTFISILIALISTVLSAGYVIYHLGVR